MRNPRFLQVIQPNGTSAVGTRNYYNDEYPLLKKWLKGEKLNSTDQHKIANLTTYNKYKTPLYRGTVVSESDLNEGTKYYKIPGLQIWTTNNKKAKKSANDSKKSLKKVRVVFMSNKNSTNKIKTYNVQGKGKGNFSNRNTEIIVNRPIFIAYYNYAKIENGIYYVPVVFTESHKDPIVNKKTTTRLNHLKKLYKKSTTV